MTDFFYKKFYLPTKPQLNEYGMSRIIDFFPHQNLFTCKLTRQDYEQSLKDGFIKLNPRTMDFIGTTSIRKETKDRILKCKKINEPLKFIYVKEKDSFIFDFVKDFNTLKPKTISIFREFFLSAPISMELLNLLNENNHIVNITPLRFVITLLKEDKNFSNLNFKRISGNYKNAVVYITEEECEIYKREVVPIYMSWLKTKKIKSKKLIVKNPKIEWKLSTIEKDPQFRKITRKSGVFYTNDKDTSFVFDEKTKYCQRIIKKENDYFKSTIFYKTGEVKLESYHDILKDKEQSFLSGVADVSQIKPINGIGTKLFNLNGELSAQTYYGLSNRVQNIDYCSDYSKTWNAFFSKLEKHFKLNIDFETKAYIANIFYFQHHLNIRHIEKTLREKYDIEYKNYIDLQNLIEDLFLLFKH